VENEIRKEIQSIREDRATDSQRIKNIEDGLKPILKEFKEAIKDVIILQNEQERIKNVDLAKQIADEAATLYRDIYEPIIEELVDSKINTFHTEVRWKMILTVGSIIGPLGLVVLGWILP